MRVIPLVFVLAACESDKYVLDTSDTADTGVTQCGRIRGTEGVLMYQDDGSTVRSPLESPNPTDVTTGVAGPLGDDRTYAAVIDGRVLLSVDGGCNWEAQGALGSGDWRLRAAGERIYAFDMRSTAGARSDDGGLSWTPFDAGEAFIGLPVVDPFDPTRLRGLQSRGVVTTADGGDTWTAGAGLPGTLGTPADGDLSATNLEIAVVGGSGGAWRTSDAGGTWLPIIEDAAVTALAIHPDDPAVFFAQSTDGEGVRTISRSADSGGTWARQVDSTQIELSVEPELWPVPGNPLRALAAYGPVYNENTESDGVNLYIVTGGEGTRSIFVGTWFHIHQFAFGGDRWVAAVDAVTGG